MWGAIKKAINSNLNKPLDVLITEKVLETNGKIDAKASQTSLNSLQNNISNLQTAITSLQTNLNSLKMTVDTVNTNVGFVVNGRVVKSVQRGVVVPLSSSHTSSSVPAHTIPISKVNPTKCLVFLNGDYGYWDSGSGDSTFSPYIMDLLVNSLVVCSSVDRGGTSVCRISWQVIEFY